MFSHPKDFTQSAPPELGTMAGLKTEFEKELPSDSGISVDGVSDHEKCPKTLKVLRGHAVNFPLIGDLDLK